MNYVSYVIVCIAYVDLAVFRCCCLLPYQGISLNLNFEILVLQYSPELLVFNNELFNDITCTLSPSVPGL